MDSASQIRSRLFSLVNRGIKYELNRMVQASRLFGDPHKAYKSVHVAGTNGKGSTCAYTESVLRQAGFKTGLYTSPHILNFEERFRVNGKPVAEQIWLDVYHSQEKVIRELNLTFFEAATLMAFEIFKREGVEFAVFETGMGGRLDATNIITPEVSVITKLAMDHTEYLGDTLEKVACEKLGIVKPGVPLVMADPSDDQIRRKTIQLCSETTSPLRFVKSDQVSDLTSGPEGLSFRWEGDLYNLPLFGKHQLINAVCALNALHVIINIPVSVMQKGICETRLAGRFQEVTVGKQQFVLDVGHNPDAAIVLAEALRTRFGSEKPLFVVGVMKDKDYMPMLETLAPRASGFIFARPDTERAEAAESLLEASKSLSVPGKTASSVAHAVEMACNSGAGSVCVTGSFYTVGEAMIALGVKP